MHGTKLLGTVTSKMRTLCTRTSRFMTRKWNSIVRELQAKKYRTKEFFTRSEEKTIIVGGMKKSTSYCNAPVSAKSVEHDSSTHYKLYMMPLKKQNRLI